jgi:hypothetical protein
MGPSPTSQGRSPETAGALRSFGGFFTFRRLQDVEEDLEDLRIECAKPDHCPIWPQPWLSDPSGDPLAETGPLFNSDERTGVLRPRQEVKIS